MGDPLSVASGIAGLLSIAGLMFSRTYKFAKAAKGAESSIQTLADEIRTLAGLLQSLSLVAIELETSPTDSAFRLSHVISCQQVLLKIDRRTRDADPSNAGDNKVRSFMKKLKWPFSSIETTELVAEITRHQRLITVALSADSITHLQKLLSGQDDLRKGIKDIQEELDRQRELATRISLDEKRKEVLRFFGSVDPTTNHETSKGLRHHETGLWILSHDSFIAWNNNLSSRLWLSGIPGAGKTVLASVLIEEVMRQSTPEKAIAYFYCDYKDEQRQKLSNILGGIACQLARQDASQRSFAVLQDYYTACHPPDKSASAPKSSTLLGLIQEMSAFFDGVSIVVDALDECGSDRTEVVEVLASLNGDILSNIRTAFLSRDEPDIKSILGDFVHIPIAAHNDDLKIFVAEEIEARIRKRKLRIKNPALKNEIIEALINGADGMFRWVACQIDYLCTLPHDRARREALTGLPPDLNSTYERILGRVAKQPSSTQRVVRDTLLWTMCAAEPLSIEELCEALSVDESTSHLDPDSRPTEEDILEYCSSLLRKAVSGNHLELAHFTVQEYLRSNALRDHQELALFHVNSVEHTEYLAKVCLKYLNSEDFSHTSILDYDAWQTSTRTYPFRSHASLRWDVYASRYWNNRAIREQAQALFHPQKTFQFINWAQYFALLGFMVVDEHIFETTTRAVTTNGVSPLHFAAMLHLDWAVKWLLDQNLDVNQWSVIGTPLHCALLNIHAVSGQVCSWSSGSISDMCSRARPDQVGNEGLSPVLELLFASGADPTLSYRDCDGRHYNALEICILYTGRTQELLHLFPNATACLSSRCLQMLENDLPLGRHAIAQDVIVSLETEHLDPALKLRVDSLAEALKLSTKVPGQRPQFKSTGKGKRPVSLAQAVRLDAVEILEDLLRDSPECVDGVIADEGMNLLHLAAHHGSLGAAGLLVARGANIEAQDVDGKTALHECAYRDSVNVLKFLLNEGADPGKVDKNGRTIWHLAAVEDNVAGLELLFRQGPKATASLSKMDARGLTAFFSAAEAGSRTSTLVLFPHMTSFEGRTEEGHAFAHFAILFDLGDLQTFVDNGLDLHVKNNDGSSVIHYYAEMFLSEKCADGWQEMKNRIRYFLDMGISARATNNNGQAPLHVLLSESSWNERGDWIRGLFCAILEALATSDTINLKDLNGKAALELFCSHQTLEEKHPEILQTLLTLGADVTAKCSSGISSLQILFETHQKAEKTSDDHQILNDTLLLMIDFLQDFDELTKTSLGARILYWAVEAKQLHLAETLLKKGVEPSWRLSEKDHNSALDCACLVSSSKELFRTLVDKCDKDTLNNPHPVTGYNLLHMLCSHTSSSVDVELMEMLIQMGLNIELREQEDGKTPLLLACFNVNNGKLNFVRHLIRAGADTSAQSNHGTTVAHSAAAGGSLTVLEILDSVGALEGLSRRTVVGFFFNRANGSQRVSGCNSWHSAAYNRYRAADCLRYLFERRIFTDVDCRTDSGETTLQLAAYSGAVDGLKYLLSIGADPNSSNDTGDTALHFAAVSEEVEIINILASAGGSVDAASSTGMLPLHSAAKNGKKEAVDALLKLKSSYAPDKANITPYGYARIGSHESTAQLLQKHEFSLSGERLSTEQNLSTSMKIAIQQGDLYLCRNLVEQGVRPKTLHASCEGCTPVCLAFARNNSDLVKYLIESGFPVTGQLCEDWPDRGFTPILLALRSKNKDTLKLALEHAPYLEPFHQDSLVFAAVWFRDHQCLEMLLDHIQLHTKQSTAQGELKDTMETHAADQISPVGCLLESDPEVFSSASILDTQLRTTDSAWLKRYMVPSGVVFEDLESFTALHLAASNGDEVSTMLLLQHGANVHMLNSMCRTPLHYAATRASLGVISCLIQHGADVDARDGYLKTTAMRAAEVGTSEILQKLYESGADFSLRDHFGTDTLACACTSSADTLATVLNKGYRPTLDYSGLSPLGIALSNKNPGVASLALNSALSFDHASDLSRVFLNRMIREQKPSVFRKLMRRASPSSLPFPTLEQARRIYGISALHIAVSADKPDMLEILLQHGADIEYHEEYHGTPLFAACAAGRFSSVKLLVRRRAAISYSKDGTIWDGVGAAKRFPEIVAWLLYGRFTSQNALTDFADPGTRDWACGLWSGVEEVEVPLEGELRRRMKESLLGHCVRISELRRSRLGTVWKGVR